jgi:hypothetical protein
MLDPHCGAERVGPTRPRLGARVVTLLAPVAGAWRLGERQPTCLPPLPARVCNDIGSQGASW